MEGKALEVLIKKVGLCIPLVVSESVIKACNSTYKRYFQTVATYDELAAKKPLDFQELAKSPSAVAEIKKQLADGKGLQASILTECVVAQTLANCFGLDRFADIDTNDAVPVQLLGLIQRAQNISDGSTFRYCFYNDRMKSAILQCGSSKTIDIVLIYGNEGIRIEVKEQASKLSEPDITGYYNEDGVLTPDDHFQKGRSEYLPLIEAFNGCTNVFEYEGHNFGLCPYLTPEIVEPILSSVFEEKRIDAYIITLDSSLEVVLPSHLSDFVSFEGSEIRTAGRNYMSCFTPVFAREKIADLGGSINEDGVVSLPYDPKYLVKERGKESYGRYSIGSLMFVRIDDATINGNLISFQFSKIQQKKPTISLHLKANSNEMAALYQQLKASNPDFDA